MPLDRAIKDKSKKVDIGVYEIPRCTPPYVKMIQTGENSWLCKLCYQVDGKSFTARINKEVASVLISTGTRFVK